MVKPDIFGVGIYNYHLEKMGIIIQSTSGIKDINSGNICMKKPVEDKLEYHQEGDHKTASSVMLGTFQILEFWINREKSLQ